MQQNTQIQTLCLERGLGSCISVEQVHGGLVHRMWHVQTTQGEYAVKQLSEHAVANPEITSDFIRCENIAKQFSVSGIPAVSAIIHGGEVVYVEGNFFAAVYPWFTAITEPKYSIRLERNRVVGNLLAKMHTIGSKYSEKGPFWHVMVTDEDLNMMRDAATQDDRDWSAQFLTLLPTLSEMNSRCSVAFRTLENDLVVSHRDLNPSNILWDSQSTPHVIDWESAGATNPTMEMLATAIEWSLDESNSINEEAFRAFIRAYASNHKVHTTHLPAALLCTCSHMLVWLKFNIERLHTATDEEERVLRLKETSSCLQWLTLIPSKVEILDWVTEEV